MGMSYLTTTPDALVAAANSISEINSNLGVVNNAAAIPTAKILAAAADEVSGAIAGLFSSHAHEYQVLSAQASAFQARVVQGLTAAAGAYAGAEASSAALLRSAGQQVAGAVNAASGRAGSGGAAAASTPDDSAKAQLRPGVADATTAATVPAQSAAGPASGAATATGGTAASAGATGSTAAPSVPAATGAATTTPGGAGTGLTATYATSSQWSNGFVAHYTITNTGTAPMSNWQLQFNLPGNESITNLWNGQVSQSGTQYTVTPESYNGTIAPGSSVTVGFQGAHSGNYSAPTNLLVNGHPVGDTGAGSGPGSTGTGTGGTGTGTTGGTGSTGSAGGTGTGSGAGTGSTGTSGGTGTGTGGGIGTGPTGGAGTGASTGGSGLTATYTPTSRWDSGFVADLKITNTGTAPVTNWNLQFDLPADESITGAWSGQLAHSGTHYTVTPESWTQTIAPGGSVTVGIQATQTGAYAGPTNLLLNGQPTAGTGGTSTGGTATGGTSTGGTSTGGTSTGGTSTGGTGTGTGGTSATGSGVYSPYVDITLWPGPNGYDFATAAQNGVTHATLAFVNADPAGHPAWGGYSAYDVTGGSQSAFIDNQIAGMRNAGISGTISFGGAFGTDLSAVSGQTPAALAQQYASVVNTYHIYNLDFDVEGALQGNTQAMSTQSKAIALLQQQMAANGTPVSVSYTLPVLPTGLVPGQGGGLNVLQTATANGVNISHVNIMAMDYGNGFDQAGNPGMGQYAIDAATATHGQLMTLYPSMSSQQAWSMLGVTPLVGINDDPLEIFTLADAQKLTTFAVQNHIGELSMWELPRDISGTLGAVDAVDGSGIAQTPFQFSKIFEQIEGAPRL
ncbi:cellulose binding domain-containing protein [Mycobacterium sp. Z3061]|uniref:cellulose binding domain-containing protein n=1 Tax=Mycobacterium sp. Z3061 TaxID=3073562 RepID=UPI002873574C|nr:cellulose binding domain-containing protein [Mycobacterium sp. Z3061]